MDFIFGVQWIKQYTQCLKWGGVASRFFSKSPETIPLPFNSRKIIPPHS
jgi:hypothetical protein